MISEFQDLSDKIDRLAQLTQSLRAENKLLRQANGLLNAENTALKERLAEAQRRVEALLGHFPALESDAADDTDQAGPDAAQPNEASQ